MGARMLPGIFVGYHQHAGGGWSGDLLVVDPEELATAEHVSQVTIKRFKYQEVDIISENGVFEFPLIQNDLKQPGGMPPYVRKKRQPPVRELVPFEETSEGAGRTAPEEQNKSSEETGPTVH